VRAVREGESALKIQKLARNGITGLPEGQIS